MRRQTLKNSRHLRGRRTYTAGELLVVLKVHRQTLGQWRKRGLAPIDTGIRPWLYLGQVVKDFVSGQVNRRRVKLAPEEFYCLRCKAARKSKPDKLAEVNSGKTLGKGHVSVILIGECEECGCRLRKAWSKIVSQPVSPSQCKNEQMGD